MKHRRSKSKEKLPLFWFGCYGTYSPAKEDCIRCEQLKWCRDAGNKKHSSDGDFSGIIRTMGAALNVESNPDFQYFDDEAHGRSFTLEEIVQVLSYVFRLSIREFYYLQCKLISPKITMREMGHPVRQSRTDVIKQLKKIEARKPELQLLLRLRRHIKIRSKDVPRVYRKGVLLNGDVPCL